MSDPAECVQVDVYTQARLVELRHDEPPPFLLVLTRRDGEQFGVDVGTIERAREFVDEFAPRVVKIMCAAAEDGQTVMRSLDLHDSDSALVIWERAGRPASRTVTLH